MISLKRIVIASLLVGIQLLVGGLFLVMLFSSNTEKNGILVVNNKNINKEIDIITNIFNNKNKIEIVDETINEETGIDIIEEPVIEVKPEYTILDRYEGTLTGYGPDCAGCSGITNSDYDVRNTITYQDPQFGEVRIVAADPTIPAYSIVRISNVKGIDPIIAIVLDTGGNVGFGKYTLFDLLFSSEAEANATIGTRRNITYEILRYGKA